MIFVLVRPSKYKMSTLIISIAKFFQVGNKLTRENKSSSGVVGVKILGTQV